MANEQGYTFLRWNGEYGDRANFIVKSNATGKQTFFTPGRTQDIAWTSEDLTKSVPNWEDFAEEQVDNLDDVVF